MFLLKSNPEIKMYISSLRLHLKPRSSLHGSEFGSPAVQFEWNLDEGLGRHGTVTIMFLYF